MINKFLLDCKEPKNTDFFLPKPSDPAYSLRSENSMLLI